MSVKDLVKKYNSLSIPAKASIWFVLCNCVQKATQIITTPIYTRIMTTSQYGEYTVFLSWVEFVAILATLDIFYSGFNVGMEKFRNDRRAYSSSMHGLCFALTTFWVVIAFLFTDLLSGLMGISSLHIRLLACYMYVYPVYLFWSAQKKYDYKYKPLLIVTLLASIFSVLIGGLAGYFSTDKSTGVIVAKIIVEAVIALPILWASINGVRSLFNKYYWKYALKFNIPLVPHYLSTMVLNHSDRIMILNMCGSSDAAIYSVAYSIAMLMTIIQNAVNSAITPWLYGKLSEKNTSGIRSVLTGIISFIALCNFILILVGPEAINILGTNEYHNAIWIIPPVSFGVFLTCIYGLFVNVELFFGNNKLAALGSFVAAIVNLLLNYIFIHMFGYLAAGYTTLVSYLLLTIVHYFGVKHICKQKDMLLNAVFDIKAVCLIILFFGLLVIGASLCYGFILIRYGLVIVMLTICFVYRRKIIRIFKLL